MQQNQLPLDILGKIEHPNHRKTLISHLEPSQAAVFSAIAVQACFDLIDRLKLSDNGDELIDKITEMTVAMSVNQFFSPRLRSKLLSFRDTFTDELVVLIMSRAIMLGGTTYAASVVDQIVASILASNQTCFPNSSTGAVSVYRYQEKDFTDFILENWWTGVFFVIVTNIDFTELHSMKSPPKPTPYQGRGQAGR